MNEERLDLINVLLNIMEFIRLIPVLLYYKWPQATRAMVVIDACFRILQSFLPLELSVMKRSFLIGISLDCFLNYCGDFWSNLIILNTSRTWSKILPNSKFHMFNSSNGTVEFHYYTKSDRQRTCELVCLTAPRGGQLTKKVSIALESW